MDRAHVVGWKQEVLMRTLTHSITAILLVLSVHPSPAFAQRRGGSPGSGQIAADQTFFEFQVDHAARPKSGPAPAYPDSLRAAKVEGEVLCQYVVDADGFPQMRTFKVLKSTNELFTEAVKRALGSMTFFPAELQGQPVKQLVQQPFKFSLKHE